ncbi:MAG: YlxR family protein, partial [Clostridiales Family XIII bacterium]|nr:YlxR family protein [Clostridiales Family XIII bacterium]
MRRCVGCMESKPKRVLMRLAAVDGKPTFDPTGKANGRGVYLCGNAECF